MRFVVTLEQELVERIEIVVDAENAREAKEAADKPSNFIGVVVSGLGMGAFVFMVDALTPRRKLGALAGVFFGLIVGLKKFLYNFLSPM
jgi:hypothetical protein